MVSIILQAIKLALRLFFQLYFQPSKVYDFINESKKNEYIFLWSIFLSGLLLGGILAIPHYILYKNLSNSMLFAVSGSFTFTVAVAFAGTAAGVFTVTVAAAAAIVGPGALTVAFTVAGAVVGAVSAASTIKGVISNAFAIAFVNVSAFAFVGTIAFILAGVSASVGFTNLLITLFPPAVGQLILLFTVISWFIIIYLFYEDNKFNFNDNIVNSIFLLGCFLLLFAGARGKIQFVKAYEMIIYSFAFLMGYFFSSSFYFTDEKKSYQNFGKVQKSSLIWGPLIASFIFFITYFEKTNVFNQQIIIMAWSFALMPLFILHIPDYLLCLPLWFHQLRKILKNCDNSKVMVRLYEQSILFRHERLYFQLPGLHRLILLFAKQKGAGMKEAVKRINYLHRYTFQQKQAKNAIIILGKDKETAHKYIHFLLEERNLLIIDTLAEDNPLAELYLSLFEKTEKSLERDHIPIHERIDRFCQKMDEMEGNRFNEEMLKTLKAVYKFLTSSSLKNFYEACDYLDSIVDFPLEIKYFRDIQQIIPQLKEIKNELIKTESIEEFETKRSSLIQQKESLEALSKITEINLYQPFQDIWRKALIHCSELVEQEIKLLLNTASLSIDLKNKEILVSPYERKLYFDISNNGQGLASDILIKLQKDIPGISFLKTTLPIPILEAGKVKEINFAISPSLQGKETIRGTITFSDMVMKNKVVSFFCPITILEEKKSIGFTEITNPYVVGTPLKSDKLYFGREDAYEFIDKNIMASGECHTIVCHGLRRTGKTSLLYRILREGFTNKQLIPINIDMQGIEDERHFYNKLYNEIMDKLSLHYHLTVEKFSQFKQFLDEIRPELREKIIVLMVDEFEELQMRVEVGRISRTIFSNIRHLMQHEEKLVFLFCGTHKLEEMSADYWSIFFNTATYLRISYLKPNDARHLIKEPVKNQLRYDPLAVEQIIKMTYGHPYLIQLICRTLINDLNENKKKDYAVIDDVDDAVERIILEGDDGFSLEIWKKSNLLDRLILSAAAEELTYKQLDYIGADAILKKIEVITSNFSKKEMREALKDFVSKGILEEKNLFYFFPINFLRRWIVARYPLRKLREEI